jgi:hypothetical protein
MFEEIVAGLVVAGVAGPAGFILKSQFFTKPKYLPEVGVSHNIDAYQSMEGEWHEYHFTYDPKLDTSRVLAHAVVEFTLGKNLIVMGKSTVKVEHRRGLSYKIRGEINSGNLYYTAVCVEDPSDAYSAMFKNLLDDQALIGVISGWDYEKASFVSPLLLSKKELEYKEVERILLQSKIKFFGLEH